MFAIAWGLLYFLSVYLFNAQSSPFTDELGISVLYSLSAFFVVPFFLRYFEAQRKNQDPMFRIEQILFSVSVLAIGTKGGIIVSPTPASFIAGIFYIVVFVVFNKGLDASYQRIGVYSQQYYERVMGEFPLRDEKHISQFRVLIYMLPIMLIIAVLFWKKG